jgi:type IV pilus assembly protein PilP
MRRLACALILLAAACGDDDRSAPPPKKPPGGGGAPKAGPPAQLAPPPAPGRDELLAEVRKRQLNNEDFAESENNRDPFRSFLSTFAVQPPIVSRQHKIVLQKFALDELRLVAIVGGEGMPAKAMFIDPGGLGTLVQRGDHVSKSDALVQRIAPDRVFFTIEEDAGGGKTRQIEKVVELHAGEILTQ